MSPWCSLSWQYKVLALPHCWLIRLWMTCFQPIDCCSWKAVNTTYPLLSSSAGVGPCHFTRPPVAYSTVSIPALMLLYLFPCFYACLHAFVSPLMLQSLFWCFYPWYCVSASALMLLSLWLWLYPCCHAPISVLMLLILLSCSKLYLSSDVSISAIMLLSL